MAAARSGFHARMEDVRRSIERFTESKNTCDKKATECSEILQKLREELAALDKRLHTLRPGLKLDTLEKRCMGMGMDIWEWGIEKRCMGIGE